MVRFLFAFIMLLHGLIHLMGFAKAFKYAEIQQLTLPISKSAGALWLLAAVLFTLAAAMFLLKKDTWWMAAVPAIVLSQGLIFISWADAKFGTVANVIVLAVAIAAYGAWSFDGMVRRDKAAFLATTLPPREVLTRERMAALPPVMQRWLEHSGVLGKDVMHFVHLRQKGNMRTKPDSAWIPFEAEQYNTVDKPGFLWDARVQMAPLLTLVGRDKYENGQGHMLIKMLYLFPVADAKGPETDQGSMLRYLGEMSWFPSAFLCDYIRWEQPDSLSAKATMTYGGITASGVFRFHPNGDLASFEAKRYYDRPGGATLEDWHVVNTGYRDFNGMRIPHKSEVTWKLAGRDFTWLNLEITALEYNEAALAQ